jgi:hypothetical protein
MSCYVREMIWDMKVPLDRKRLRSDYRFMSSILSRTLTYKLISISLVFTTHQTIIKPHLIAIITSMFTASKLLITSLLII